MYVDGPKAAGSCYIFDRVPDLAELTSVIDAADQRLCQAKLPIAGLKPDRAAVGTGMILVDLKRDLGIVGIYRRRGRPV